ncbi:1-aminocyclopropane-1-carboxylate deaminase/D-cysteine desulfhydrase [Streptomyces taklimakanensis]|uniref:1-aminocyclopropane-1-carboxylate deaminase/D-cysteine desulfhydrase n=1 Tax=Streptomyces taklimakanensis TaxID=2569853 RepID=UPI003B75BB9C
MNSPVHGDPDPPPSAAPSGPPLNGLDALDALSARLPSPLTEVADERFARRDVRLLLKRDDLIHPEVTGNKWRKLVPNLRAALRDGEHTLLTFGGAYSNHLRATAAAGRLLGLSTVGVVRGEELAHRPLNASLARCAADGMRLHFVTRAAYRRRNDPEWISELRALFGPFRLVPEGGSNAEAVRGAAGLGRELRGAADVVGVACGTGGTLAGLAAGLADGQRAVGFAVLRGGFLPAEVERLQRAAFGDRRGTWTVEERFHCGGYARTTDALEGFARDFADRHGLPGMDRIYVAKMLYGLSVLADEGAFAPGTSVAAVVTG